MNWQAGTMLHPGAQQREHRKNVSAYRKIRHAETTTERGNQAAHHALNPSTTWVSPSHGHQGSIPIELFNAKITLSHCLLNRGKITAGEQYTYGSIGYLAI